MEKTYIYYFISLLLVATVEAEEIGARLQDGTPLLIDPISRSVQVLKDGVVGRSLWDGVHRLDNGTTLTVSGGVLIRQVGSTHERESNTTDTPSRCEALLTQACGDQDQCTTSPGCQAARQLLHMEEQERQPGERHSALTPTSTTCTDASRDRDYFVPCSQKNKDNKHNK